MTLHDALRFGAPPRPRPLPMPPPAPLRCRTCGEEVFPNGKLRACRCDRRAYWQVALVFVGLPLAFLVAFLVLR